MKKYALILLTFFACTFSQAYAQTKIAELDYSSLGFVSYLTYVKSVSENYIKFQLDDLARLDAKIKADKNDTAKTTDTAVITHRRQVREADSILYVQKSADLDKSMQKYATVKIAFDQILLQMMADMNSRNRIRLYKKLNKNLITHKSITAMDDDGSLTGRYVVILKKADLLFQDIKNDYDMKKIPMPAITPLMNLEPGSAADLLGLAWTAIKDIQDMNADKVESIDKLMNDLRLAPLSELTAGSDSSSESGKDDK